MLLESTQLMLTNTFYEKVETLSIVKACTMLATYKTPMSKVYLLLEEHYHLSMMIIWSRVLGLGMVIS